MPISTTAAFQTASLLGADETSIKPCDMPYRTAMANRFPPQLMIPSAATVSV
jgi:hypothetical protein